MAPFIVENPEVYYAPEPLSVVGPDAIAFLKERAAENPRKRSRLCLHAAPGDALHEMLIVHHRSAYVRPHRHLHKPESLTVIEGEATAFVFGDAGDVERVIPLGPPSTDRAFSYRMPEGTWHGLVIDSEWLVFSESTAGPFDRAGTEFPAWAPDGSDAAAAADYVAALA